MILFAMYFLKLLGRVWWTNSLEEWLLNFFFTWNGSVAENLHPAKFHLGSFQPSANLVNYKPTCIFITHFFLHLFLLLLSFIFFWMMIHRLVLITGLGSWHTVIISPHFILISYLFLQQELAPFFSCPLLSPEMLYFFFFKIMSICISCPCGILFWIFPKILCKWYCTRDERFLSVSYTF